MALRLTTWNANSIRLRLDLVERIAAELAPDVLCLQEIKVETEKFPHAPFAALGFAHRHVHGQKGYHGVAILSKIPFDEVGIRHWCGIEEARHAYCKLANGLELHDLYIPAGGDVPDPEQNPKFAHKLKMVRELAEWLEAEPRDSRKLALVGDLNIAPLENDVWSHRQLLDVVSHTPVETELLTRMQHAFGFVDALRVLVPPEQKLYSWWSYRNRDWAASDRGRRLDHIWLSPALAPDLRGGSILREARGWEKASDHVPVTVDLAL